MVGRRCPPPRTIKQRVERLAAPKDLKPGFYFIIASPDPKFSEQNNQVSFTAFWVSKLAIVMRNQHGAGKIEGFVLDANSGEPLADVDDQDLDAREQQSIVRRRRRARPTRTACFRSTARTNRSYVLLATLGRSATFVATISISITTTTTPRPSTQTIFFTDRSLYRPGQTIQYKGICIQVDQDNDNYDTIANRDVDGHLPRPQRQGDRPAASRRRNDYGSFSGSFTAPRDRLMGHM